MTPLLVCAYCGHLLAEGVSHCANCLAPVRHDHKHKPEVKAAAVKPAAARKEEREVAEHHEPVAKAHSRFPSWLGPFAFFVIMVIVAIVAVRWHGPSHPRQQFTDPVAVLPPALRDNAECHQPAPDHSVECTVHATNMLLRPNLSGGRDLTVHAQLLPADQAAAAVTTWRNQGAEIVLNSKVVTAIGTSLQVLYANTTTGLILETTTLRTLPDARAFVSRAGLSLPPL